MEQSLIEQGIRLKKLIKALNLNQSSFAQSLGMTQPNISRMVSGESTISVKVLNGITDTYNQVNLLWLLTGEGSMFREREPGEMEAVEEPVLRHSAGRGRLEEMEARIEWLEQELARLKEELANRR